MEFYETQEMTGSQIRKFTVEFDRIIGTEREINNSAPTRYYAVCGDLLPSEVRTVREIENKITGITP
jgi:hypothetical protein